MHVEQIIRASADVITITNLAPGDCYKRVVDDPYGNDLGRAIVVGVVRSVMNNGTDAAVSTTEYGRTYNGVTMSQRVIDGSKPAAIFPATPEEVREHVEALRATAAAAVDKAEEAARQARATLHSILALADDLQGEQLTSPAVETPVLDVLS